MNLTQFFNRICLETYDINLILKFNSDICIFRIMSIFTYVRFITLCNKKMLQSPIKEGEGACKRIQKVHTKLHNQNIII